MKNSLAFFATVLILTTTLGLTGCGKDSASPAVDKNFGLTIVGSYMAANHETCKDFGGAFTTENIQAACTNTVTTYSASPCPSANRVGSCKVVDLPATTLPWIERSYAPLTTEDAQTVCANDAVEGADGTTTEFLAN